jgi:HAE1 family hydrophobic/amphiphilic exporter-1
VELRLVGIDRSSRDAISQLYVRTSPEAWSTAAPVARAPSRPAASTSSPSTAPTGSPSLTRLDNVVRFTYAESPPRVDRVDRQRMAAVRANLAPGYALADRIDAFHQAAKEMGLPAGYVTRVAGRGRELERTFQDFGWILGLSIIFMYLVLAAQFEHLVHPLTILISLPLAIPFGLLSLLAGGETLNLYSALGILVLFGVVKKNSILQVDHTNQLRAAGADRLTAIIEANRHRLRPILMTTIAFVMGLLPLLIAAGPGAEERRSIAVLAVGGQTLSLLLTLLATPVIYSIFDDMSQLMPRKVAANEPAERVPPVRAAAVSSPPFAGVPGTALAPDK